MSELDLTSPDSYTYWTDDKIRFADLDRLGHVNNVTFAVYSETGRVDFLEELYPGCTDGTGVGWVIARTTINFLAAAYYPGTVKIGSVVRRVGNSSVMLDQGLFSNGKCFGTCETVLVWADTQNETSLALPADLKEKLLGYLKE